MHIGERADVIVCADQEPGYYPIELHYDYACTMSPHGGPGGLPPFIPPGFHEVSSCRFYSFLHYTGQKEWFYGPPTSDKGTGGGKNPKPVAGVPFDLTRPADWKKTKMLNRKRYLSIQPFSILIYVVLVSDYDTLKKSKITKWDFGCVSVCPRTA